MMIGGQREFNVYDTPKSHNKYCTASKTGDSDVLDKYRQALSNFRLPKNVEKQLEKLSQSSFSGYMYFLIGCLVVFHAIGGSLMLTTSRDMLGYISGIAENVGLLSLRYKITRQKSVKGISGGTITMYALVYLIRLMVVLPPLQLDAIDEWGVKVLSFVSLLLVLDVRRSVFSTYEKSYQKDLDVLPIKYLIPGCVGLAAILHPALQEGLFFSFSWASCLYLDVLALMPQVVMMSKNGGKVEALLSHFVAATAMSRLFDLGFWYYAFDMIGSQGYIGEFNFSGWLIVFWHVVHILLVADFMYYHAKARLSGASLLDDMTLGDGEICV